MRNLDRRTPLDLLRETFGKYGEVKDVYMPRDHVTREPKGFAFVEVLPRLLPSQLLSHLALQFGCRIHSRPVSMQFNDERDAKDAMDAMDRQSLDGREVRPSRPNLRTLPRPVETVLMPSMKNDRTRCPSP